MRIGALLAATAATLALALAARADDIVLLKNGGRLRGQVMSEHPQDGVKMKLADGRTRVVPANEVQQVIYDDQAPQAPAPKAPSAPVPAPAQAPPPPAPPPPPPREVGTVEVTSDEPGIVSIDGEEVGKTPFSRKDVPVGAHRVAIAFDAGGSAEEERVFVEKDKAATVALAPSPEQKQFRQRRGPSFGASLEGMFLYPAGAPTPYGGGRLSVFLNVGVHPAVDLRVGASGGAAAGAHGATTYPVGGFFAAAFHASRAVLSVGVQGGYAPGAEVRAFSTMDPPGPSGVPYTAEMGPIATIGGLVGVGIALGADRRWEIGVRQDLSAVVAAGYGLSGANGDAIPGLAATTTFGLTGLFFASRPAPKPSAEVTP